MDQIPYQDFKYALREMNPKLTCNQCKDIYNIVYEKNTIASCKPAMPVELIESYINYLDSPVSKNQEGEKPMCKSAYNAGYSTASVVAVAAPTSIEATQRDFYSSRVRQVMNKHEQDLRKQFFMDAADEPRTAKQVIDMITNGEYSLDEKKIAEVGEDELRYYPTFYGIRWGKNTPDKEGYKTARKVLADVAQDYVDAGTLQPVDKLADLLKEFQDWKYEA